jgi:GT2 family glycosyltransferase
MVVAVIPAYLSRAHEPAQLAACVTAVTAQRAIGRAVVVDDGSPLPFPALPAGAELLRLGRNRGPAAARNAGLERALALGARAVLFTDVDCLPDPGWAEALLAALDAGGRAAVGGVTRALGATLLDRYHDFAGTLNGRWNLPGHETLLYATTCNMAVRATALDGVRFDERFPTAAGEDYDFCHRLKGAGPIGLAPAAVVRHDFAYGTSRRGLAAFRRQFRRYGEADPLLWELHPELRGIPSEACAAADLLAATPPADPAAWRRGASSRVRPRRFRLPMILLRHVARAAYKEGQQHPLPWRTP